MRLSQTLALVTVGIAAFASVASAQDAGRVQRASAVIDAPVEAVWEAFTTEEGIEAWMVPVTSIDLRVGGEWRTSYNPESTLDDADTIVHTILSYEPQRMISVRTRPPESAARVFGDVDFSQLWSVFRFDPTDDGRTRVTISGMGYGEGAAWDRVYGFFEANNPLVMQELAAHFAEHPATASPDAGAGAGVRSDAASASDTDRVMELLHRWVGGEWIHEGRPPGGGVFRVRNVIEEGPDGVSLLSRGWLGNEAGMFPHALAIIRRSATGGVVFQNVNEAGDVASGRITLADRNTLRWDWSVTRLEGGEGRYDIRVSFPDDPNAYSMTIGEVVEEPDGRERVVPMVQADFQRVPEAPEAFRRLLRSPGE
ncbi:MAG: SRPBCC domain-containing protein [Phycisphaerales bacterium]|nr:SRPBCC domain-containing protein [Phycisphaerales bacterium]